MGQHTQYTFNYEGIRFNLFIEEYFTKRYGFNPASVISLPKDYAQMLNVVKKVDKEKYILDIGANSGMFSVPSSILGYKTLNFEPVKMNVESLNKAKETNSLTDFNIFECAVAKDDGTDVIFVPECSDNTSFNRDVAISNMVDKKYTEEYVTKVNIDNWLEANPEYKNIGLIKIDVQGYELPVLQSMVNLLSKCEDVYIICEWDTTHTKGAGFELNDILKLIMSFGFQETNFSTKEDKVFYKRDNNNVVALPSKLSFNERFEICILDHEFPHAEMPIDKRYFHMRAKVSKVVSSIPDRQHFIFDTQQEAENYLGTTLIPAICPIVDSTFTIRKVYSK